MARNETRINLTKQPKYGYLVFSSQKIIKEDKKMADVFGRLLIDYFKGKGSIETIRRDDGQVNEMSMKRYFTDYPEWEDFEKEILGYVQGRVLDIGAGAGRHSLYLQKQGFEVHAIDISPRAVEVMRKREVRNVYLMDLRKLDFPENYFDSILMMFNNFGLAGTIKETKKLLKLLYRVSTPQARIITTIRDPYQTDNPAHLAYHEKNKKEERPAGQVTLRIECKDEIGDWFSLLMVSPEELKDLIKDTGWNILKIVEGKEGEYGAVLKKD